MSPDPPGPVLAIETTQRTGGVALRGPDGTLHVERFEPRRRHDDRLMPTIAAIATEAGITPADLTAICVSVGPGGFSGLRIGIATAQLLAFANDAVTVPVPTAELVAAGTPGLPPRGRVVVCLASKNGRAWLAPLERTDPDAAWTARPDDTTRAATTAGAGAEAGTAAAATGDETDLAALAPDAILGDEHLPEAFAGIAPVIAPVFDPAACLTAGLARLARGETVEPAALRPIYPGPPEAVVRWQERHGTPGTSPPR